MKTIVSTKSFRWGIQKALAIDCHCMSITDGNIEFLTKKYQQDFSFGITKHYQSGSTSIVFNPIRMIRLMYFLAQLPEQPIVIEMTNEKVELTQFTAKF